jgi:hypothetical protein
LMYRAVTDFALRAEMEKRAPRAVAHLSWDQNAERIRSLLLRAREEGRQS